MTDAGDGTLSSASLDEPGCTHGANAFTNNAGANIEGDGCLLENDKTDGGCVNDDEYIETQEEFSDRDASCSSGGMCTVFPFSFFAYEFGHSGIYFNAATWLYSALTDPLKIQHKLLEMNVA